MENKLDALFLQFKNHIFKLIREKNIDIDILAFDLGIGRKTFINNFVNRSDDFTFYLQTLSLAEHWESNV